MDLQAGALISAWSLGGLPGGEQGRREEQGLEGIAQGASTLCQRDRWGNRVVSHVAQCEPTCLTSCSLLRFPGSRPDILYQKLPKMDSGIDIVTGSFYSGEQASFIKKKIYISNTGLGKFLKTSEGEMSEQIERVAGGVRGRRETEE